MALSTTSFSSAGMVAKVKQAMREATRHGYFGHVYNRRGKQSMICVYNKGQGFRFWHAGRDVSALVVAGARKFHARA